MGLVQQIREFISSTPQARVIESNIASAPKTVDDNGVKSLLNVDGYAEHQINLEKYASIFTVPLVYGSISKQVDFALSVEPVFNGEETSVKAAKAFLNRLNFRDFEYRTLLTTAVYGFCAWEKLGELTVENGVQKVNLNNVLRLKFIDPTTFFVKLDANGRVVSYAQKVSLTAKTIELEKDRVVYFCNKLPYGNSKLLPLAMEYRIPGKKNYNAVNNKLLSESAFAELLEKYANPHIHVKMGQPGDIVPANALNDAQTKLEALRNNSHWVTGGDTSMEVLQVEGKAISLIPHLSYVDRQIIAALQTPEVLLGFGNIPEGLADRQMAAFYLKIRADLQAFEDVVEEQLLTPYLTSINLTPVEIDWEEFPEIEEKRIALITGLLSNQSLTSSTKAELENKIRAMLNIEGKVTPLDVNSAKPVPPAPLNLPQESAKKAYDVLETLQFPHAVSKEVSEKFNVRQSAIDFIRQYAFGEITANTDVIPELKSILIAGIESGKSIRKMTNELADVMGKEKYADAERLIRTELARAENEGALTSFTKGKVQEVEWLTAEDERVDDEICNPRNGERYSLIQAEGMLPAHPGCRCTWVPIV